MILALDTATTTGWAHGPAGARPPLLQWGSRTFKGDSNGEIVGVFRAWLNELCYKLHPTLIVFESPYIPVPRQPRFGKGGVAPAFVKGPPPPMNPLTLRRLLGITAQIEASAWELRIECREATTTEVCKVFTGRGSWGGRDQKKAATIATCRAYGWDVAENDNAADALALWAMAEKIVSPRAHSQRPIDGRLMLPIAAAPKTTNAPRSHNRRALKRSTSDEMESSNGGQFEFIDPAEKIQPAGTKSA